MEEMEYPPFDNTVTMSDDAGNPVRFLTDPLQEHYIVPPGDLFEDGMLPPEDLEVRRATIAMKLCTERLACLGVWTRLFRRAEYQEAYDMAAEAQRRLRKLVNSTPAHKAAIRRIVNAMPPGNGGREALASYIL